MELKEIDQERFESSFTIPFQQNENKKSANKADEMSMIDVHSQNINYFYSLFIISRIFI